jgi:hypothetical protein
LQPERCLDLNAGGVAEVVLGRGYDESGDIEIYEFKRGELRLVLALRGRYDS